MRKQFAWAALISVFLLAPALAQDPSVRGAEQTMRVTLGRDVPDAYGNKSTVDVVLPINPSRRYPTILFLHGWFTVPSWYQSLIDNLASRGYAVAIFNQVNRLDVRLDRWVIGATNAVDAVFAAANDPTSPVYGQLDLTRFGLVGHSYGGATSIVLGATDPRVKTVVALAPGANEGANRQLFLRHAAQQRVPILVIGCEFDPIVPARRFAWPAFQAMPAANRLYVEIARAEHNNFMDFGRYGFWVFHPLTRRFAFTLRPREQKRISRNYTNAWVDHYLGGKPDTSGWIDGRKAREGQRRDVLSLFDHR
ncbi:MAG: dienelactone hydrolase family protein [Planctomycetes bacterium]|nr:dienelactone hydrolase family protein [Planctomycetota bacterium]